MDAPDLIDGFLGNDPEAAVLADVPLPAVITDQDVIGQRILLAALGPATAGHNARLVLVVACLDRLLQRLGPPTPMRGAAPED